MIVLHLPKLPLLIMLFLLSQDKIAMAQTSHAWKQAELPNYQASLAGKSQGIISQEEIVNAKMLTLGQTGKPPYHITSYKMTLVCKDQDIREFENENNGELTPAMLFAIKHAESGCKIYFEYIKIANPADSIHSVKHILPLSFILK